MQENAAAERLGTAISLLSLDRVVPYFTSMGLTPSQEHAQAIKECVRQAIEANRRQFIVDPGSVPELKANVTEAFDRRFGSSGRVALFRWLAEDFIHTTADRAPVFDWHLLLSLACRDPSRWSALSLPVTVNEHARLYLIKAVDTSDIEAIEDSLEGLPLSAWDVQMYLIHGFDDEDDDSGMCPFMWVRETVQNHRFRQYLGWLRARLSATEQHAFVSAGRTLKSQIASTQKLPPLLDPFEIGGRTNAAH